MKQVNAEIISLGTELLLGQIANTNAEWLSKELSTFGINVFYHSVVGDNPKRVQSLFEEAKERSNLIIVTGGLGPTDDDMTREAFQKLTKLPMYEDENALEKIKNYFERNHQRMTPNNRKQALVFESSKVLTNELGMAPGMIISFDEVFWILLPGVPREMKAIFKRDVRPFLNTITDQKQIITSRTLRFIGISEADLEYQIAPLIKGQTNPTIAPLSQENGLTIRLTVKANNDQEAQKKLDVVEEEILEIVGDYYYGKDDDTIQEVILQLLRKHNYTLSAAESLTGGLFTSELISVPGASKVIPGSVITYDQKIKSKTLGVSENIIKTHGVVSKQCAREMAKKIKEKMGTSIGISFTGVAGPDSLEGQKVGTVFISVCLKGQVKDFSFVLQGKREQIRKRAVMKGYEILYQLLK